MQNDPPRTDPRRLTEQQLAADREHGRSRGPSLVRATSQASVGSDASHASPSFPVVVDPMTHTVSVASPSGPAITIPTLGSSGPATSVATPVQGGPEGVPSPASVTQPRPISSVGALVSQLAASQRGSTASFPDEDPSTIGDVPLGMAAAAKCTQEEAVKDVERSIEQLLVEHEEVMRRPVASKAGWLEVFRVHGAQCLVTVLALVLVVFLMPDAVTIWAAASTVLFYFVCIAVELLLVWARNGELRMRCYSAIAAHKSDPERRFQPGDMAGLRGLVGKQALCAAHVLREGKISITTKVLLRRGDIVLNPKTGQFERYGRSLGPSRLYDCLKYALTRSAVLLPRLTNVARPPRLPNLQFRGGEEEDDSSDESDPDLDGEPRCLSEGGALPTVPMAMELATHRLLLLVWTACIAIGVLLGLLRASARNTPIADEAIFAPFVAFLGLIPLNSFLLHRVLVLIGNAALYNCVEYLKRQTSMYGFLNRDERVPKPVMECLRRTVRCLQLKNLDKPLCFARNSIETLGYVTTVAPLDFEGVLTDIVPVPVAVLFINRNEGESSSSSSDDDENQGDFLSQTKIEERKRARRRLRMQVRRAKFQQKRFTELELTNSASEALPMEFIHENDVSTNKASLNPLCLCVVIHSVHSLARRDDPRVWSSQRLDKSIMWSRCAHWMARAAGFSEASAMRYKVLKRIHLFRTKPNSRRSEQLCGLLTTPDNGHTLHLFTIGDVAMSVEACSSYWTGDEIEEFDAHEKDELLTVGQEQWEKGRTFEPIVFAHRVLPQRYHRFLLPDGGRLDGPVEELYFRNGERVEDYCAQVRQKGRTRRSELGRNRARSAQRHRPENEFSAPEDIEPPRRRLSVGDKPHTKSLESDTVLHKGNAAMMMMTCDHTFLGMVGLRDNVRPNIEAAVSMLSDAGVRFTHFGRGSEAQTKAFGSRVGLETDFNSCVSLKDESVALDPNSIRAQLPFGIKSIRTHLMFVDHIPLQVSLFSHSRSASTRSMISILQDNHEVVCVIGSGANYMHMRTFIQADLAIASTPTTASSALEKADLINRGNGDDYIDLNHQPTSHNLKEVYGMLGSVCAMTLPPTANTLPMLTVLIRESRLLMRAITNVTEFVLHASCFVAILHGLALVFGLPLLLSPTGTLWVINVIVPVLSVSCSYTNESTPVMQLMPQKHNAQARLKIFVHSAAILLMTFGPTAIFIVLVGLASIVSVAKDAAISDIVWGPKVLSESEMALVHGFMMLTVTWSLCFHALCRTTRHQYITLFLRTAAANTKYFSAIRNYRWMVSTVIAILLALLNVAVSASSSLFRAGRIPRTLWVAAFLFPVAIILMDFPIKRWRYTNFAHIQKFRKLFFNTRLGMHSPRGDYEPSEPEESHSGAGSSRRGSNAGNPSGERLTLAERFERRLLRWTAYQGGRMERNSVVAE